MDIKVFSKIVSREDVLALANSTYIDMVKGVVDVEKKVLALGGELHSDCEEVLLDQGCLQKDLWGFNIYPAKPRDEYLEFTSLINIRPKLGNMGREIQDPQLRAKIKTIIDNMVQQ